MILTRVMNLLRGLGVLLLVAAVVLSLIYVPFSNILESVRHQGAWGPPLLAVIYVVTCLLFIPGSILNLAGGFFFGVVRGTLATLAGGILGATAAFLVGRTLARGWVQRVMARRRRFQAINRAVDRQGFKIVLLTRLSPIYPFNLLNYAFGLTRVSLRDYVVATSIGIIPSTVMYVCLGSAAKNLAELLSGQADIGHQIVLGVGLVATVAVTIMVMRVARVALRDEIPGGDNGHQDNPEVPEGGELSA